MSNQEIKSLSKTQMLELLHRQELEIERLTKELESRPKNEHEELLSAIIKSAQDAADAYLENIKLAHESINSDGNISTSAFESADSLREVANKTQKALANMNLYFALMSKQLQTINEALQETIKETD